MIGVEAHDFHPRVFRLSLTGEVCEECQTRGNHNNNNNPFPNVPQLGGYYSPSSSSNDPTGSSSSSPIHAQFVSQQQQQQRRHTVIGTQGRPAAIVPGALLQGLIL